MNNPYLIGEPGVGKTATAEDLTKLIVAGNVPETIEVHALISAGAAEGAIDAANILKPALALGEITLELALRMNVYSILSRFQPVLVPKPTVDEMIQIVWGLREI